MKSSPSPSPSYRTHSGKKRARLTTSADDPHPNHVSAPDSIESSSPSAQFPIHSSASSSFRNVSACNRCRLRKNRCDQNLPACSPCEKAGVKCVGFDPITKREIPRTYVYYLESRISYLESLLHEHGVTYAPSQEFDLGAKSLPEQSTGSNSVSDRTTTTKNVSTSRGKSAKVQSLDSSRQEWEKSQDETDKLNKLVSNIGMVSVQGTSDPRYLGSTSGISFARIVFAAVKSSVSSASSEKGTSKVGKAGYASPAATNESSMRDSFFGLHIKPTFKQAPFPNKKLGLRLVELYFEHANPQIPILHRGEFMLLFDRVYTSKDRSKSPRELYMLNIVFAIGAGIILEDSNAGQSPDVPISDTWPEHHSVPKETEKHVFTRQMQPEEYHSSAMVHLESCLGSGLSADRREGFGGGLDGLQAVLLLASFALLRPVAPGLWYITGVAVRLGVDLGLHYEDGTGVEVGQNIVGTTKSEDLANSAGGVSLSDAAVLSDEKEQGRREWVRDLRRRLWWCIYSFDRLVSTCVGRPFGISDQVITTEFPSILDDTHITTDGFSIPSDSFTGPSYKRIAHHYFRLRLLQSEILQVLQYRQAQKVHASDRTNRKQFMHTDLQSPFLQQFESFHSWRQDIDRRLWDWKESAPFQQDTTVKFPTEFLELNYWQAVIMLYRQSLSVPPPLAGEINPSDDVTSPVPLSLDYQQDEDETFLKVAEAGQKVLKLYRQLHRLRLVNYTYLATVHLFMAGIAFLYAIWHSTTVRSRLTIDDVDFTILAATSVLEDLMDKCPPAEACRDAFDRMSKATVKMCMSTTGFGSRTATFDHSLQKPSQPNPTPQYDISDFSPQQHFGGTSRPPPQFDMNLRDLFPVELDERPFGSNIGRREGPPGSIPSSTASSVPVHSQDITNLGIRQPRSIIPVVTEQSQPTMVSSNTTYDIYGFPNTYEFDFLASGNEKSTTFYGDSGLDLGIDEGHDWSDGMQMDLFDGFFFGNVGNQGS